MEQIERDFENEWVKIPFLIRWLVGRKKLAKVLYVQGWLDAKAGKGK
jgi:hypothetical protein